MVRERRATRLDTSGTLVTVSTPMSQVLGYLLSQFFAFLARMKIHSKYSRYMSCSLYNPLDVLSSAWGRGINCLPKILTCSHYPLLRPPRLGREQKDTEEFEYLVATETAFAFPAFLSIFLALLVGTYRA